MIPVTYPSSLSYKTTRQMVAFPIADITGKRRWTDYIPVKFVNQTTFTIENAHNNNAYVAVDVLSSITNLKEGIDYIPIYIDDAATDAWQVSATGYIPVGYSGASLSLQFAGATTLDSRITFTRASSARYFNNQGVLTSAGNNVARFDHDPVTKLPRGLLIEEQRTNLLTYSEQFDNAAWTKGADASVSANQTTAPDGAVSADKLQESSTASSNAHSVSQSVSLASATTYSVTVYAKASERTQFSIQFGTGAGAFSVFQLATFDLTTQAAVVGGGTGTASMTDVGNGWYRCVFVTNATTSATSMNLIINLRSGGVATYAGTVGFGLFIWGAQLEAGSFATSYIPTVAAQVTRSADSASMTGSNFSSWYNATEGTLFVDGGTYITYAGASQFPWLAQIDDGTSNNRWYCLQRVLSGYTDQSYAVAVGGVNQAAFDTNANNGAQKRAIAVKANDFAFVVGGAIQNTDTSGSVPTVNRLLIGAQTGGSNLLNGHIRKIAFYPARLANAHLQALTA